MLILRPYQREAVDACYQYLREKDGNPCIVCPTGAGKSIILAQICRDAVDLWNGRVLVLTHVRELIEQNTEKIKLLLKDHDIGIYSAGLKQRDKHQSIIVASIQSIYKKACDFEPFDLVIVDECFPAGTQISTPRGDMPIEDLYIGQPVHTALGVGKIEVLSGRTTNRLIELELENGKTIRCTPNHPFLTEQGWRKAKTLEVGSCLFRREDMQALQQSDAAQNIFESQRQPENLHVGRGMEGEDVLLSKMRSPEKTQASIAAPAPTSIVESDENLHGEKDMRMLRERILSVDEERSQRQNQQQYAREFVEKAAFLFDLLRQESGERHVASWRQEESKPHSEENGAFSHPTRWKRATHRAANATLENSGERVVSGVCHSNRSTSPQGDAPKYQDRHCQSGHESSHRAGRALSCDDTKSQGGPKTSPVFASQRVVRVTHIQCESPVPVFNMQVEGHPSYYADGVLAHNCHLINTNDEGMYRAFLKDAKIINPSLRVIGTTATPFRLSSGLICGPENILNEICYEIGIKELIRDGYLCPLRSKAGKEKVDTDSLHIRGGEFIAGEVETLMDADHHVKAACAEIVELTQDRQSVLIFASGIAHGRHIVETLHREHGLECGFITGDTPTLERDELIGRFRRQTSGDLLGSAAPLKYLCNVNVLTTGFDAPNIDCVVLLRPTMSPGLYCQQVGRGFRLCEGKTDCLILDFGGNILRHGPVDGVRITEVNHGNGDAPAKECPQCNEVIHAAYATCPACGFEFPPPTRNNHDGEASSEDILSGKVIMTEYPVRTVYYSVHVKRDKPEGPFSMRVDYEVGWQHSISEWICFEHTGYARHKAEQWWKHRSFEPVPESAEQAVELACDNRIAETNSITVRRVSGEKYDRIVNYQLGEKPEPRVWRDPEPDYAPAFDDSDIPF